MHYYFTDKEQLRAAISRGEFVESVEVHDNVYGTSRMALAAVSARSVILFLCISSLNKHDFLPCRSSENIKASTEGRVPVFDIDVTGARSILAKPEIGALFIFIKPPKIEDLKKRLMSRSTESLEVESVYFCSCLTFLFIVNIHVNRICNRIIFCVFFKI